MRLISKKELKPEKRDKNQKSCKLCKSKLTVEQFKKHLCLDVESIKCPLCPRSNEFYTTVSFLEHTSQHTKRTESTDELLYKCDYCNIGYRMEILLQCHKIAHENVDQQPENRHFSTEPDKTISIDETNSNDYSILTDSSDTLITVEMEMDESASDEEVEIIAYEESDEDDLYNNSIQTSISTSTFKPKTRSLKRKITTRSTMLNIFIFFFFLIFSLC